ncbi:MAG: hypothetical protein JWM68_3136 [Verrucomicrobiales bacterium]|nr:hypothetical protein [Verrucomicrobiales bacterium]
MGISNFMKKRMLWCAAVVLAGFSSFAAVLPAEKLLPDDTLVFISVPDCARFRTIFDSSPQGQLWADPAMKPFKDNFLKKIQADLVAPLEKDLGIRFSDYKELAEGELAFALTQNSADAKSEESLGMVLLLDAKDKKEKLKTTLADLKKKWTEAGKELKTTKIRDLDFVTLITTDDEIDNIWQKVFPDKDRDAAKDAKKPAKKIEITIGQSESLLIVGNSVKPIEKILARQAGGLVPPLADQPVYQGNRAAMFNGADAFIWVNLKAGLDLAMKASGSAESANPLLPKPEKLLAGMGLGGLKSAALAYRSSNEGSLIQFCLGVPEGERKGIVKLLTADAKDSGPPVFVPADAVKFTRWRLDLQKTWNGLESMLAEVMPAATGVFKMVFDAAGKDQDPNFDLRKELIGNFGDDVITFERTPKGTTLSELSSPPALFLISSANGEKLANAFKVGVSSLGGQQGPEFKEREFLGRKIYTAGAPAGLGLNAGGPAKNLHFSASGGYLAISTDVAMLEEYLRSSDTKAKPLSATPGLNEIAQKVGGMGTGLFGFENQSEQIRVAMDSVKKDPTFGELFATGPLGSQLADSKKFKEWCDFSLLPSYDAVSKYFYYTVYAGGFDATGFNMKFFAPTPPQLKK